MTDETLIQELLALAPEDILSTSGQLNITTDTERDILNAFRVLAWLNRKSHIGMLGLMVVAEAQFLQETGKLEQERRSQATQAVRRARRDERIV